MEQVPTGTDVISRLQWALDRLDDCGKKISFTLGMVRSLNDCKDFAARNIGRTEIVNPAYLAALRERREIHYFTVRGMGDFAFDMLRFDEAWPTTPEDMAKIMALRELDAGKDQRGVREIRLGCAHRAGPTVKRWESFGWLVLPGPVEAEDAA